MQLKEFDVLIDIKKHNKTEYFEVVQGDSNSNILNISLVDGLKKFNLTNTNIEIIFNKSDGTTVQQTDISIINEIEGRIQSVLKTNTIAAPGKVIAEVRILQDETLLTSTTFEFWVRKSLINDKTIESTNEFPLLEKLAEDAQVIFDTEADRVAAEGIRVDNEGTRIVDEDARVQAESDRSVNETERISNEHTRTSNEITRIEDENLRASAELLRIDADAIREVNEQARNDAEVIRNNDEGIRQTNESDRAEAESIRIAGESDRTTAESSRATAESGRVTAEQDRADAESARVLAEQARDANYTQKIDDFVAEAERVEAIYPTRLANVENELTELSYITQRYTIDSWQKVQDIARAGLANKMFRVGDQLLTQYNGVEHIVDIIGINHDVDEGDVGDTITIQFRDCLLNGQFDAAEALYYAEEEELPVGEHVFTLNNLKYKFTTLQTVPSGGQIYIPSWSDPYIPLRATTYDVDRVTAIESNLEVTPVESGVDTLSLINHHQRCRYGSNNYKESAVRQWLNSDEETFVWAPQTNFDRPPSGYPASGFLKLLQPELASVLVATEKQVARNTVTDGGGQDILTDKVFLLSRVEVGLGTEGNTTGETVYKFWEGATDADRIKVLGYSPRSWFVRSPHTGYAHHVRIVSTSGVLNSSNAIFSYGLPPACKIS